MKVRGTVSSGEWAQRPRRGRRSSPVVLEIAQAVAKTTWGEWVVVSLTEAEKKRQPTIRGQLTAAAAQEGVKVRFEMRGGDLGVTRAS